MSSRPGSGVTASAGVAAATGNAAGASESASDRQRGSRHGQRSERIHVLGPVPLVGAGWVATLQAGFTGYS